MEDHGKRWPRLTSTTAALTKFREIQHSWWECGTDERRRGVPTWPHFRKIPRERQKVPHRAIFPLFTGVGRWPWDHPPGDQCPTLGPEGWLQPNVCCQCSKVIFHGELQREFGVVARQDGILLLSVPNGGVKFAHAWTDAFVRAWVRRGHDELHRAMAFKCLAFSAIIYCSTQEYDMPLTRNDEGDHCEK